MQEQHQKSCQRNAKNCHTYFGSLIRKRLFDSDKAALFWHAKASTFAEVK
jgi:hypothetical protein